MARAYLRLDPAFFEKKVIDQAYPAGAALALIGALCHAEYQPTRGRFRSSAVLKTLLGPHAKWVGYLIEKKDLIEKKGQLYVDGWDEWQEGDWKVTERVRRIRSRRNVTPDVTVPVTADVTPDVTVATESNGTVGTVYTPSSVIDSGGGRRSDSPQPPARGGRPSRRNGTSPRQVAKADDHTKRLERTRRETAELRAVLEATTPKKPELDEGDEPEWGEHARIEGPIGDLV